METQVRSVTVTHSSAILVHCYTLNRPKLKIQLLKNNDLNASLQFSITPPRRTRRYASVFVRRLSKSQPNRTAWPSRPRVDLSPKTAATTRSWRSTSLAPRSSKSSTRETRKETLLFTLHAKKINQNVCPSFYAQVFISNDL